VTFDLALATSVCCSFIPNILVFFLTETGLAPALFLQGDMQKSSKECYQV
jgi:hypothetical protein